MAGIFDFISRLFAQEAEEDDDEDFEDDDELEEDGEDNEDEEDNEEEGEEDNEEEDEEEGESDKDEEDKDENKDNDNKDEDTDKDKDGSDGNSDENKQGKDKGDNNSGEDSGGRYEGKGSSSKPGEGGASKLAGVKDKINKIKDLKQDADQLKYVAENAGEIAKEAVKQKVKEETKKYVAKAIVPYLPYIGIALLVILAIILIIFLITSIMSFFAAKSDPENMKNNEYITNTAFYGIRVAYVDDAALTDALQLSYKQFAVDVSTQITEMDDGLEGEITLAIELPADGFDNTTEVDEHINNISLGLANIAAGQTNYEGFSYSAIDFATLYPQIPYFGFDKTTQGDIVNNYIKYYVTTYSAELFTFPDGSDVNQIIQSALDSTNLQYIYNLCEKVMIKDEIATAEGLSNIEQRNYVGSIYMPHTNIDVSNSFYTIANENENPLTQIKFMYNDNGTVTTIGEDVLNDENGVFDGVTWGTCKVDKFTAIDEENTAAFSQGVSLFEAIRLSPEGKDYSTFFTQTTLEDGTLVFTWIPTSINTLYYEYSSNSPFIFTDFDFNYSVAS